MPWKLAPVEHGTRVPAEGPLLTRRDVVLALAAAAIAFGVYLATMYPGLMGMGDAAKFAFVGKVLGTPHAPGYPLYVMVSHLFSYVPLGSLAYRMNVLSGILAAVAVALLYVGCRILQARPAVAFATSLALGFGRAFWSKAQYPKGYSLNAALVCAGIVLLLRWGRTRRPSHLYWAIAVFALASGNHLIIVALVPALLLYVLATDWRLGLSPRTLAITALLVTLGLSQYSLIVIRTLQGAPYLEAKATNFSELVSVMTARRYSNEIVAFSPQEVVDRRIPMVARLIKDEMTTAGLLLAAGGFVALCWRRRWREAVLCGLGALGVAKLTSNMSSNEDEGFLLPTFVLLWLLVAAGLEALAAAVSRATAASHARAARAVTAAIVVLALVLPAEQLVANYRRSDHSRRTFEIRYYAALFEVLPDRSAIVLDQYNINMLIRYKLLGEGAAKGRDIRMVPQEPERVAELRRHGYQIYAFQEGRGALTNYGYEFERIDLYDLPLPLYLDEVADRWTVAVAATPGVANLLRQNRAGWRRVGASDEHIFSEAKQPYALIGSTGGGRDATSAGEAVVTVAAGTRLGDETPVLTEAVTAGANDSEAWISIGGRERARARGAVIGIIDPVGRAEVYPLEARMKLRVPFNPFVQSLYRVTRAEVCRDIGNAGWRDIGDLAGEGRLSLVINNYRPFLSKTTLYVGGPEGAVPTLTEVSGRGRPQMRVEVFDPSTAAGRAALQNAAAADGVAAVGDLIRRPRVTRVEIDVNDDGDQKAMQIELGAVPPAAYIRTTVDLNNPKRAIVCGAEPVGR